MENIQAMIREENGKLVVEWDQERLIYIAHLIDGYGHAVIDAEGYPLDLALYNLDELCQEYLNE
jgi:hypothetical protein